MACLTKGAIDAAIEYMADKAEKDGGDANDTNGVVRRVVEEGVAGKSLGLYAWFSVCCELADRAAKRQGYKSEVDRAYSVALAKVEERKHGPV